MSKEVETRKRYSRILADLELRVLVYLGVGRAKLKDREERRVHWEVGGRFEGDGDGDGVSCRVDGDGDGVSCRCDEDGVSCRFDEDGVSCRFDGDGDGVSCRCDGDGISCRFDGDGGRVTNRLMEMGMEMEMQV